MPEVHRREKERRGFAKRRDLLRRADLPLFAHRLGAEQKVIQPGVRNALRQRAHAGEGDFDCGFPRHLALGSGVKHAPFPAHQFQHAGGIQDVAEGLFGGFFLGIRQIDVIGRVHADLHARRREGLPDGERLIRRQADALPEGVFKAVQPPVSDPESRFLRIFVPLFVKGKGIAARPEFDHLIASKSLFNWRLSSSLV